MNHRLIILPALFFTLLCNQSTSLATCLIDIYTIAKAQDTVFREAEANHLANAQASPIARAALLPQVNFSAETSDNNLKTEGQTFGVSGGEVDYNSHGYSLRLTQALYNRDFYVQLKQANNSVARSQAQFDASKQDLILRVTELYFNVLAARDDLRFATAEKQAIKRQLEQAENRFEVGLIPITDVKEAQ